MPKWMRRKRFEKKQKSYEVLEKGKESFWMRYERSSFRIFVEEDDDDDDFL